MSNYTDKYLKYKKKYINLKNISDYDKYGGGGLFNVIIFYDNTNPMINDIFDKIKIDYINHIKNIQNLNKPYYISRDRIMKNINLLLNVFFYKFCTNMVQPLLDFNLHDLVVSNRYIPYRSAFNKAKQKYIDTSTFKFNDDMLIINKPHTCDALQLKCNNILNYINDNNINKEDRISSIKELLNIVALYQNKATNNDLQKQTPRIGFYSLTNINSIKPPSGVNATINIIDSKNNKDTILNENIINDTITSNKMKNYINNSERIEKLILDISDLKFNNINEMIYLKKVSNNKFEVINIFRPLDISSINSQNDTNNNDTNNNDS